MSDEKIIYLTKSSFKHRYNVPIRVECHNYIYFHGLVIGYDNVTIRHIYVNSKGEKLSGSLQNVMAAAKKDFLENVYKPLKEKHAQSKSGREVTPASGVNIGDKVRTQPTIMMSRAGTNGTITHIGYGKVDVVWPDSPGAYIYYIANWSELIYE